MSSPILKPAYTHTDVVTLFLSGFAWLLFFFDPRCWEVVAWFQNQQSPKHIILWIGLTWLPLILGAWCTTVGVVYARPNALSFVSPQPGKPHSLALRTGITPTAVNVFVFSIPVIQVVSVVVPVVLAQKRYSWAFDHHQRWSASVQPGDVLSRDMLLDAQQIWFEVLDAAYLLSICMTVWEAWVCGLFICHCLAGGSLVATLRKQLTTLKSFKQNRTFSESFSVRNGESAHVRSPTNAYPNIVVGSDLDQHEGDIEKHAISPANGERMLSVQAPPRSLSTSSAVSGNTTLVSGDSNLQWSACHQGPCNGKLVGDMHIIASNQDDNAQEQTRSMYFTQQELENEDLPSHTFFPSVRPSAFERPAPSVSETQNSHKRYLEKFYMNFVVQFVGLMLCMLFFAIFCGKLTTTWYSAWEANDFASALEVALLVVCWVTVVLASIIILAILSRTYEPVLSNISAATHSRSSGSRSRHFSLSRTNDAFTRRLSAKRLSDAKTWAASMLSHQHSQEIGLEQVRSRRRSSRAGSLSGVGRTSLYAYAELDGEQQSPNVESNAYSPNSRPLTLRKATMSSSTPDLQATTIFSRSLNESQRQRSLRGTVTSPPSKGNKTGVLVEQTVSTIVEHPAVEEHYQVERPPRAIYASPSRSALSPHHDFALYSIDGAFSTPGCSHVESDWTQSPATPVTIWTPSTPSSAKPLVRRAQSNGHDSNSSLSPHSHEPLVTLDGQEFVLHPLHPRPRSQSAKNRSKNEVGLGIAMTSTSPWTAPLVWDSGHPDPVLMKEDAEMRLRMASRAISERM